MNYCVCIRYTLQDFILCTEFSERQLNTIHDVLNLQLLKGDPTIENEDKTSPSEIQQLNTESTNTAVQCTAVKEIAGYQEETTSFAGVQGT